MEKFIIRPDITLHCGIRVDKDTSIAYENENIKQSIKDLKMNCILKEKSEIYESKTDLKIKLKKGDILLFDEERGYILPGIPMQTIKEVREELKEIEEL